MNPNGSCGYKVAGLQGCKPLSVGVTSSHPDTIRSKTLYALLFCLFATPWVATAQAYQSFFTGDTVDVVAPSVGGIVLMGGGAENDEAMRWFLERCGGGDVVVLRASGSNGYNDYLFGGLGVMVNSVESIVTPDQLAANDPYVARQVRRAEGLWIAGGDQANYVRFWKDSPVGDALRYLMDEKRVVIGGSSAGMAILGEAYFAALNGSITSAQALANPFDSKLTLGGGDFLKHPLLRNVVTDTHYDNRDRRGRHLAFLARMMKDFGILPKGIACNESTAVCIDTSGYARVFGNYPQGDHFAYFLQANCENDFVGPEACAPGKPLDWVRQHTAVRVFKAPGRPDGSAGFDLNNWADATEGAWENWWVEQGRVYTDSATGPLQCLLEAPETGEGPAAAADIRWNIPTPGHLRIAIPEDNLPARIRFFDLHGRLLREWQAASADSAYRLPAYCHGPHIVLVLGAQRKTSQLVAIP